MISSFGNIYGNDINIQNEFNRIEKDVHNKEQEVTKPDSEKPFSSHLYWQRREGPFNPDPSVFKEEIITPYYPFSPVGKIVDGRNTESAIVYVPKTASENADSYLGGRKITVITAKK